MFSSSPSQRLMIDNLRKAKQSGKSVKDIISSSQKSVSVESPDRSARRSRSPKPQASSMRLSSRDAASPSSQGLNTGRMLKITSESIEDDLARMDARGTSVRKIAEAFAGFSVERDGIMLDAFRTRSLGYEDFRMLLKRSVNVVFSDSEFEHIIEIFDRDLNGSVDGEEFLTVCKLLARAVKNIKNRRNREREREVARAAKEKEMKDHAEREAILESAADYLFTKKDEESMLEKMVAAAAKVNKQEPGAPPLHGFEPLYLKPKEVLVLLKNAFRVYLTPKELGSLIRLFDYESRGLLDTTAFLTKFSRWGVEWRDAHRSEQIEKSRAAQKALHDRSIELLKARDEERENRLDKFFTDSDKESALVKLRVAAKGYRKGHASSMGLEGFSSVTMTPGIFDEMVRRTFGLDLTGKELGAVVNMFSIEDSDLINVQAFLVFFGRTGTEERFKDHSSQLSKNQSSVNFHDDKRAALLAAAHDRNLLKEEILSQHKHDDKESAIRKLKFAARHYTLGIHGMPGDLDVFKVDKMTPIVFQEKLQKFLGVILTPHETAALLTMFNYGDDQVFVDCHKFSQYFKRIGLGEKEELWKRERERRMEVIQSAAQYNEVLKKKFMSMVEQGAVDYNYSKSDEESALRKMEIGASQYDATNPQAIRLAAFDSAAITPGQLKEKLNRTFNIDLNPRELGSVIKGRIDADGNISCADIVNYIKELGKSVREKLRKKRLETVRQELIAEQQRDLQRKEAKKKAMEDQLLHDLEDEKTVMIKLNAAAQAFAVDNASYVRVLHSIKCPSLSPAAFISAFYRIFLQKITVSECGLIMKVVNPWVASHHLVDGVSFLKGFYKLSRLQQAILLGQLDENELRIDLLSPTYQLDAKLRANLVPVNRSMLSLGMVFENEDSVDGLESTSNLRTSPRLQHWSVESVNGESFKLQDIRRRAATANSEATSSGFDDGSIGSITLGSLSDALQPMLPNLLAGTNPWTDWGIAEAGFLPPFSRPSTSHVIDPAVSSGRASTAENSVRGIGRLREYSPDRSRSPSVSISTNKYLESCDGLIEHSSHSGESTHIAVESQCKSNILVVHSPDRRISISESTHVSEISHNVLSSENSVEFPDIRPSSTERCSSRQKQAKDEQPLKRILKPSLPATFSKIGLARQRVRKSLGVPFEVENT